MHELSMQHPGAHHGHHNHSKSLMKGPTDDLALIDKKKEILDKKRYEQMHKNYNQMSSKAGQGMPNMSITNQGQNDD